MLAVGQNLAVDFALSTHDAADIDPFTQRREYGCCGLGKMDFLIATAVVEIADAWQDFDAHLIVEQNRANIVARSDTPEHHPFGDVAIPAA